MMRGRGTCWPRVVLHDLLDDVERALVSSLLVGSSIVMIDANPMYPDLSWQWRLAAQTRATIMGASPGFIMACRKEGLDLRAAHDLAVRIVGSAGAPLPPKATPGSPTSSGRA